MSDETPLPGQQAFDLPEFAAVPSEPVETPTRRLGKRQLLAGGAVVAATATFAAWGVSDAIASNAATHGFPHVASLSGGTSIDATAVQQAVSRFIVDINATDGYSGQEDAGTGMVITANGDVLTNNHVVAGSTSLTATLVSTGRTYKARVLGTDATHDVALIKLEGATGLTTMHPGDASSVTPGLAVATIGNALGQGTPTVTTGSITGTNKSITASDESGASSENLTGMLETDADIVSGDSGGPMVDSSGQVIGMDTAANSSSGGTGFQSSAITSSSDGYAIPITNALDIAKKIARGTASSTVVIGTPGFLGVELGSSSAGGSNGTGTDPYGYGGNTGTDPYGYGYGGGTGTDPYGYGYGGGTGTDPYGYGSSGGPAYGTAFSTAASSTTGADLTVVGVVSNSPAARAGISAGDTISSLNGTNVSSADQLTSALDATHGGQRATVGWTDANGGTHQATVTLADGPAA
jgi:S1-C subfamily serine protease